MAENARLPASNYSSPFLFLSRSKRRVVAWAFGDDSACALFAAKRGGSPPPAWYVLGARATDAKEHAGAEAADVGNAVKFSSLSRCNVESPQARRTCQHPLKESGFTHMASWPLRRRLSIKPRIKTVGPGCNEDPGLRPLAAEALILHTSPADGSCVGS